MTQDADIAEIIRLKVRCKAFETSDPSVADLLHEDYSHVHTNGLVEDKAAFLTAFKDRQRKVTREDLRVRIYDDAAIMTGKMTNFLPQKDGSIYEMKTFVTQTWLKDAGNWKLAAIQVVIKEV